MNLYKYRDLLAPDSSFARLSEILRTCAFWCARPSELNDSEELMWECDYDPSDQTAHLLAKVLTKLGRSADKAWETAWTAVQHNLVEPIARPVIENIIDQCRQNVGVACFATSAASDVMWDRYGGGGNGVCVEIDVPNNLLRAQLHPVQYSLRKRLHVDRVLASSWDPASLQTVYSVAFLTKSQLWAAEREVRFVSKRQNVSVRINDSKISRIVLGSSLTGDTAARIEVLAKSLPYHLPISKRIR